MGSMHTMLEELPQGFEKMAAYFGERAAGGVGMIMTGGIAPNSVGLSAPGLAKLTTTEEAQHHRLITDTVHRIAPDCKICMQILHVGRYAYHPQLVAPSAIKARISPFTPQEMTGAQIREHIDDYARCARLAREAGYDGIEVIGSAGYLISEFLLEFTNQRQDEWGGDYARRMRFPVEIIAAIRRAVGPDFIVVYRIAAMELLEQGSSWEEVVTLAHAIEKAGASLLSTHFTWHEARVPTLATLVPRAAFTQVTGRLREAVSVPVITSNRINMPEVAERVLAQGRAPETLLSNPSSLVFDTPDDTGNLRTLWSGSLAENSCRRARTEGATSASRTEMHHALFRHHPHPDRFAIVGIQPDTPGGRSEYAMDQHPGSNLHRTAAQQYRPAQSPTGAARRKGAGALL
jgi:2,4-dienoyl-CoA reductase (NADPH2)